MDQTEQQITGQEHWTRKGDIKLFLWEKRAGSTDGKRGTVLFVHGSSMASQPTFDLQVAGRPHSSAMEWFAQRGFDTWCVDMEGYGRPTSIATSISISRTEWTISRQRATTS